MSKYGYNLSSDNENTEISKVALIICGVVLVLMLLLSPTCCENNSNTLRVLQEQGYTNIQVKGFRFWSGDDDIYNSEFEAISPVTHKKVTGIVTSNGRENTIRLD
jgi:hypothetical protein